MTRRGWKGLLTWLCWGEAWRFHWTWNVRQYNKNYDSKTGRQQQKPPQQMSSPAGGDRPGPDWHQHCIVHSSNIVWNISFEIRSLVAKERRGEDVRWCEDVIGERRVEGGETKTRWAGGELWPWDGTQGHHRHTNTNNSLVQSQPSQEWRIMDTLDTLL